MRKQKLLLGLLAAVIAGMLLLQIPAIKDRVLWGTIQLGAYARGVFNPAGEIHPDGDRDHGYQSPGDAREH